MKQKELELELSRLGVLTEQREYLEQYRTPADVASHVLYKALGEGDISGRKVADLGTGNGIFAIGASMLGAEHVFAVDIDSRMIQLAEENARNAGVEVEFINDSVINFSKFVDTVIMNPPFGSQVRDSDLPFIEKALEISKNFYILFNYKTSDFLNGFIGGRGSIVWSEMFKMPLPYSYGFHRKEVKKIDVCLSKVMTNEVRSARTVPRDS
ncbi:MAG: METTL5 family protein [Candidatus Thermoplasmatota archaeon]|jgi:putative methylase|nr:METTL5 family protein [Candidatus Thermoplasmatota archaeon]MCL5680420.1 METTL5 family protein [Candidatus Thermoplasmatota archaeon]